MSRTYRKLPYWSNDPKLTRERGSKWTGMRVFVAPNGNVFGWDDEALRKKSSKRRTNRIRRLMGKKEIVLAVAAMAEDAMEDLNEMMDWEAEEYCDTYYDEYELSEWADWKQREIDDQAIEEYYLNEDPYYYDFDY